MTNTRPLPPRPASGGSWRFDEVLWAYVPAVPAAPAEAPAPEPEVAPAAPEATPAPPVEPDGEAPVEAPVKPQKKDARK